MNNHLTACVTLCCLLWCSVGLACPYEGCDCNGDTIYCEALGLTQIPGIIGEPYSQSSLLFDNNKITQIKAGSLLYNMAEISFSTNPITTIDNAAFNDSATTLQTLRFSNALFTKIPDAFSPLKALTDLSLSSMNVTDWNEDVMKHFNGTLQRLYLDDVGLKFWPSWIKDFPRLTELTVVSSLISYLPDDALDVFTSSLTALSLYNNSLSSVPKTISKLRALERLYLQQNKIQDLTWMPKSSLLISLSLNNNNIRDAVQLSATLRPYASTLTSVNLQSNLLTAIPKVNFLTNINSLDLTFNLISDITSGAMPPALYELNLGNNRLPSIPIIMSSLTNVTGMIFVFNSIKNIEATNFPPSVTDVLLQSNIIEEITDTAFPVNSTIQFLNFNNNPIVKFSNAAFNNLPVLEELHMAGTKLTRLPLGLSSLTRLSILDLSGITSLVCTCDEKSLETWIMRLLFDNVQGQCGLMSVYNFFFTLSPLCPSF